MAAAREMATRRPRHVDGGFSLIELLAVLVIVSILAGTAVPTLNSIRLSRGAMAGRQLQRDLTFAQQRAIATGDVSWVIFNTGASRWTVMAENPLNPGRANAVTLNDMATGKDYIFTLNTGDFGGITMSSCNFDGNTEIGFNWLGKPLNTSAANLAANGTVVLSTGQIITVRRGTGHIEYTP